MPPFAGSPEELDALAQLIEWTVEGEPAAWSRPAAPAELELIRQWLDEAGPRPYRARANRAGREGEARR